MDITMARVRSASDTCDIYFTYIKVNHLLYTCSLDPFEDGILLDTPLVCMHRYCRNTTDDEEECKRQGTTTPSTREAWKRRRKKKRCRRSSSERTSGRHRTTGPSQQADVRPPPDDRYIYTRANSVEDRRHQTTGDRTTASYRTSGATSTEPK